ncbi:cationic amino acid transporter 7 chloroplastic-like isoform X1 [Tripterygium wilfordii]|uniref:Cationic amino acid transporter 7 chloroplastic-like isoform X1 n=1 Tax=Tripterygium wilfordii TaxID=458696 RepID=A0A7J7D811_TRIWF|nr:cationic amino acid transporter 7, chloroplastic [Tripterygium wilfordii]KAF5742505.1 cationic amino acid transporter 7 chloroplastic-like isoform X1 [Tripterygium wilfordii]
MESHGSSFSSFRSYLRALAETPTRLARRAGSVSTSYEEMSRVRARSGSNMQRTLRWYDLVGFGIGGMVGAGVFVTTGSASRKYAGPAIVISYAIAGLCALLSAFCYTEFAVDMPVAGGAFSYLRVTFGEFAAFLTGANLIMEYALSNAAVARGFSGYFGTAIGVPASKWRLVVDGLPNGFNEIDFVAVIVVLTITLVICYSTRNSSVVNMLLTALHMVFIVFVIVMGFLKGDWKNFTEPGDPNSPSGFFPYGVSGVFNGASIVYLSYIGYDAVSTMAEEVRNPVKDIPIGVTGSVIIVSVLYCLMAASMSMLLPYDMIDTKAPFSAAFSGKSDGWKWVSNVVGAGASFGILTSLLVSMLGQARYMCVIGRSSVAPAWFARVHLRTSTPVNASAFLGIFTAAIALFTELEVLLDLVSIGTLFVFYMVANAVIYRRYVVVGTTNPWPTMSFLCSFSLTSIMFTLIWKFMPSREPKAILLGACAVVAIAVVQLFHCTVTQARKPEFWGVPLMPWIPCISIFLNIFLLGSLGGASYVRFLCFSAFVVVVYVLYSVHASFDAEGDGCLGQKNVIEIPKASVKSFDDPNDLKV